MWPQKPLTSNNAVNLIGAMLFFALSALFYFGVYRHFPPYLLNDSGVEILQILDFAPWPIKAFIPSYKFGLVVMIESFYGYWMQPFLYFLGHDMAVFRLAIGLVFCLTGALFFILLRKIFNLPVCLLVTTAYITSAYTIWWPLLIIRNAFCPLLLICILLGFLDLQKEKSRRGFLILIISSFLAINTYSTFKVVLPALFLSTLLAGFFILPDKTYFKKVLIAGFILLSMVVVFFIYVDISSELLFRGSYMFADTDLSVNRDVKTYLFFVMRSFFLPIYENPGGFLAEPTHLTFGRSMLNPWLYPVWCLGLVVVFYKAIKKDFMAFICLLSLIFSSLMLCVGGPSLKTHLALAPLEFMVIAYGINLLLQTPKLKKMLLVFLSIFVLLVGYLETQYMFTTVKSADEQVLDALGQDVGEFLTQHKKEFDFAIYGTYGVDLMRAFYPGYRYKTEVAPFYDEEDKSEFNEILERDSKQYDRIWLILSPGSPFFSQLKESKTFCFDQNIADKADAALFIRCKNQ